MFDGLALRYGLTPADIGATDPDTLARYIVQFRGPMPIDPATLASAARDYAEQR